MSGIWSTFACCFPRKRTRHDEGEGSETNSLLAHSVNGLSGGDNNTSNQNVGILNTTSNKAGSVVSYEVPPAGVSTVGYGAVGQGHAVLGEEGRLRVQSIASAVENRMISINHPSQSNYNSQQYSQSRRPTPSKQDLPGNTTRSNSSSPASMAAEDLPDAPPVIHLPPTTSAPDNDTASPARAGGGGNGRPDLGRSRSSTSSSVSQANSGHLAQIEGVRRVNLNLGGMWERERERGRKEKKTGGSVGTGGSAGVKKGSTSVKSGQAGVKKDEQDEKDKESKKKEPEVAAAPPSASASTTTSRPTEPKLDVNFEPEPVATQPLVETSNDSAVGLSETTTTTAPKPNEQESSKLDQPKASVQTDVNVEAEAKADGDAEADAVAGADAEADADADAGTGAGGASATANSGGGGKSGRGKKKKNRGRGRGKGGKGGR